eukprot:1357680-Pleurochrysis_carterae.AAC.1
MPNFLRASDSLTIIYLSIYPKKTAVRSPSQPVTRERPKVQSLYLSRKARSAVRKHTHSPQHIERLAVVPLCGVQNASCCRF